VFPRAEFAALHEGVARYADRLRAACGLLGMPQLLLGGSVLSDAIERTVRPNARRPAPVARCAQNHAGVNRPSPSPLPPLPTASLAGPAPT
jgi:hypothetical protein